MLVIAMLTLLILTFIAVASSRTGRIEERISNNLQKQGMTFQGAESAIEGVVAEGNGSLTANNILVQGIAAITDRPTGGRTSYLDVVNSTAKVCYNGEGSAGGFSIGVDTQSFVAHTFKIRGRGEISEIKGITTNLLNGWKLGPGGSAGVKNCPI